MSSYFYSTPDKVSPDSKDGAKQKFQEITFAYAILSDERRRRRYDMSGNTSESLDLEDDSFDWMDFYRDQFSAMVDRSAIDNIKKEYQGSNEEQHDLLTAFEQYKGDLDRVYEVVMLSNVLDDDNRFRAIIDEAIAKGEIQGWKKYKEESESKRQKRFKKAKEEAKEAEKLAKEMEEEEKKGNSHKRNRKAPPKGDDNALVALIQQRQQARAANFFDDLEAKYAQSSKGSGKSRKRGRNDEPPEEAFAAVAARKGNQPKKRD